MQRKVLITTTYNEMGIIIDTKAEEVAQPNSIPPVNPQEPKTRWIPVSERLPKEKDGSVLVTMPDKKVTTARYSEFSDKWYVGDMMEIGGPDPLAWAPLPDPYKPQEREDEK